jgi:hypothetical protein
MMKIITIRNRGLKLMKMKNYPDQSFHHLFFKNLQRQMKQPLTTLLTISLKSGLLQCLTQKLSSKL